MLHPVFYYYFFLFVFFFFFFFFFFFLFSNQNNQATNLNSKTAIQCNIKNLFHNWVKLKSLPRQLNYISSLKNCQEARFLRCFLFISPLRRENHFEWSWASMTKSSQKSLRTLEANINTPLPTIREFGFLLWQKTWLVFSSFLLFSLPLSNSIKKQKQKQ